MSSLRRNFLIKHQFQEKAEFRQVAGRARHRLVGGTVFLANTFVQVGTCNFNQISGSSIGGVRAFFASDGGVVIGWTHYLAFDLFTGLWIARDADNKGFSRVVQAPFLLVTLLVGPIGLFAWLMMRERRARATGRG